MHVNMFLWCAQLSSHSVLRDLRIHCIGIVQEMPTEGQNSTTARLDGADDAATDKGVVTPDLKEQFLTLAQSLDERLTRMEQAI